MVIVIMVDSDEFSYSSLLYNIRWFNENLKLDNTIPYLGMET